MIKRPLCLVCMAFVVTVFIYVNLNPLPEISYVDKEGSRIIVCGEVYQKENKGDKLIIYLKNVNKPDLPHNDNNISGIMCYMDKINDIPKLGSYVAVEGEISYFDEARNPGEFDMKEYYYVLGIDYKLYDTKVIAKNSRYSRYHETLYHIRCYMENIYDKVLPQRYASVMKAMLLGNKAELDRESKMLFQKSGISHILAISGLHITFLGVGLNKILKKLRLPKIICGILSVGMMIAYGDMVGMSSSAYRAVFMFGMKTLADMLKRTYDMLTALAIAAVLILAEQPLYICNSGFLLSFGAILGIGCLENVTAPKKLKSKILSSLCGSLSIFMIHFPIMISTFYEFPIYSFILNLLVIPASSLVMIAGIACLIFGFIPGMMGLGTAKLAGIVCQFILWGFEQLCSISLKLPFSDWIVGRPDNWKISIFVIVILYLYILNNYGIFISRREICEERGINIVLPFNVRYMLILAVTSFLSSSCTNDNSLTFLDVGQGDCICIENKEGKCFLIDGGSTSESKIGEYTIVPYLKYNGISKLDAVFLTHLDNDHISGIIEMLESEINISSGIDIKKICISDAVIEDDMYERLVQLCNLHDIPLYRLKTGDKISTGDVCFEVLHPDKNYKTASRNAYSLVMKLYIGDRFTALLTGDVEADGEQAVSEYLKYNMPYEYIDVYKAAHHGSKYSNTKELLSTVRPEFAIISCGEDNRYGHPHAEVIENLEATGSDILMTQNTGAITIKIYDDKYVVDTYLK